MIRLHTLVPALGLAAASALVLAGCGDNAPTCGTGTVLEDGVCVADGNTSTCGTGTVLVGDECVPDGSVICEQGTVFDTASGQCVVDPSACADGTVLVSGQCVPEDETLTADLNEAAEPNDDTGAGQFAVPALNDDVVIHGCITPRGGEADEDVWIMTASAPTLLEITADGVGGLAAGFLVQDAAIPALPNWARFGINLTGDTSRRQVYLPVAGTYLLVMDDSRALILGEAAGGPETCYYTTVKTVAMPAATPAAVPQTTGTDSGNVRVLSYTADAAGDLLDVTQNTDSSGLLTAFVVRKNGQFYGSAAYDQANDVPPFFTAGGLAASDTVEIVVDNIYNFSLTPQAYTLDFVEVSAQALPTDGSNVTVTKQNGTLTDTPWFEPNLLWFDVTAAGQVVHFALTASEGVRMRIVRGDLFTTTGALNLVSNIATTADATSFTNQHVRFRQPGRYYFWVFDTDGTGGDTYTITSTLGATTPTALTYGTAATAQPLPATGSAFHSIDLNNPVWIQASVPTVADWGGNARITFYDLAAEGWLTTTAGNVNPIQSSTQPTDGSAPVERITRGDTRDYLVRVEATGTVGSSPTYSLEIGERPHAIVGTVTSAAPLTRTGQDDLAAGASKGFIVDGTAGDAMFATITPTVATVDITAARRAVDGSTPGGTVNAGGAGEAEIVSGTLAGTPAFQAFTVANISGEATNLSFNITVPQPTQYDVTAGALAFNDACASGTQIGAVGQDDTLSAVITLPSAFATFPLLGLPVGNQLKVSSNGFLTFNTADTSSGFSNVAIPSTSAPNSLIAPFWEDLAGVTICRLDDAVNGTVTIQWTGNLYGRASETVEVQAVLHTDGVIDFIYGANQLSDGSEGPSYNSIGATVGVENAAGNFGQQLVFDTAGVSPSTSFTLTPQ